jgi:hypothetical protein
MNSTKERKVSSSIIPDQYVNTETGELLSSEVNDSVTITLKEKTNQFIINSNEYIVFDSNAIMFLTEHLNSTERGKILAMANMVKGDCCIITQKNNHPHTPETLSVTLDMNLNKFYEFIRKMVKKNILSYCTCAPSGFLQKIYMLNPYIARKRKNINCELNSFFRDITKDGEIKD